MDHDLNGDADFSDRVALVTGARRGIGRAIAAALAARGCRVAVNARDAAQLEPVAAELGDGVMAVPADVRDQAAVERMVASVLARWGRLDILVNNAAFATPTRLPGLDLEEWQRSLDVNLTGIRRSGSPRTIAPSRPGSRATARGTPWPWSG